jgi:small-conductance mechanosensitive channel
MLHRMLSVLHRYLLTALALLAGATSPLHAQEAETAPEPAPAAAPAPPDIRSLGGGSWAYFEADPDTVEARAAEFISGLETDIEGLSAPNQELARSLLESVRDNFDVYVELLKEEPAQPPVSAEPEPSYSIDDLLLIAAEVREARALASASALEVEREQRVLDGANQRRDALFKSYLAADGDDDVWLTGLRLIRARSARAISERRLELLEQTYRANQDSVELAETRLETAIPMLATVADAEELAQRIAAAEEKQAEVAAAEERLREAQLAASTLELDSAEGLSEQRLQQQRLLEANIELAGAEVAFASAEAIRWWTELSMDTSVDLDDVGQLALSWLERQRDIESQITEWKRLSEDELIAVQSVARDELTREGRRLLDLRLAIAQSTLAGIADLEADLGDLDLILGLIGNAVVDGSGALGSLLATSTRTVSNVWLNVRDVTDATLFEVRETPVTLGDILQAIAILLIALALSRGVRYLIQRMAPDRSPGTTASLYTISRLLHYTIIIFAAFIALTSIGLDFSNLALVAGALSVGIGFGLQSIVNNFVSGLIILFERSLRVGDYIELDTGLTGTVKAINVRSTLINTNDNIDIVVPNSEFVSTKLTNWTLGEHILRVRIPFGVAYGSDKEIVRKAAIEAANNVQYTLTHMPGRDPDVWLVEYGDNSLNFLLLVWVNRMGARRPTRTRAAYLWELETKLTEYGIEIPFPQRDLHLRSGWPHPDSGVATTADPAEEVPEDAD